MEEMNLIKECAELIVTTQNGSVSLLQRRFNLSYNKAGRIMDVLEKLKIVDEFTGEKKRNVFVKNLDDLSLVLNKSNIMKKTEYRISKSTIESFKIRSNDHYWADINIDANETQGRIQIASDFGNWQNYWGACGCSFKEFLTGLNIDYFASKVGAGNWFDLDKTLKYLKERIEDYAENEKQKSSLLDEFKELTDVSGKEEFIHVIQDCKEIMEMEDYCPEIIYSIEPGFKRFFNEIWPVFINEISKVKIEEK